MNTEFLAPIRALCVEYGMLQRGNMVLLALSGGRDSMALLSALMQLRKIFGFSLSAAHFNHKLRGEESERDAAFVKEYCEAHHVPIYLGEGDVRAVAALKQCGLEETARNLRYAFLEDTAASCGAQQIATAHHADDNLETFLLHLVRGAGLRGLTGIPPVRGKVIRPLLTTTRASIDLYVKENGIPFVEDSSNVDQIMARNRLRQSVIPVLKELNPNVSQLSATSIRTLRQDEVYLEAQAAALFRKAKRAEDGMVIEVSVLAATPKALASRVVRRMLEEIEAPMPSWVHINGILAIATGSDPAASIHLPGGVLVQRVYADLLIAWDFANEPLSPLDTVSVQREGETILGGWTLSCRRATAPESPQQDANRYYLSLSKVGIQLSLRARQTGDELALPGRRRKSLKKLMIEEKVPRRVRERIPVLADENGLLAVAGFGADRSRLASPGEDSLEMTFIQNETGNGKDT